MLYTTLFGSRFETYSRSPIHLASYVSPRLDRAISRPVHPGPGHRLSKEHLCAPLYRADLAELNTQLWAGSLYGTVPTYSRPPLTVVLSEQ